MEEKNNILWFEKLRLNSWEVEILIDLGIGNGKGSAWGSDLTEEYVVFNSAYRT